MCGEYAFKHVSKIHSKLYLTQEVHRANQVRTGRLKERQVVTGTGKEKRREKRWKVGFIECEIKYYLEHIQD